MKVYYSEGKRHFLQESLCSAAVQYKDGKVQPLKEFGWRKELTKDRKQLS